jgi:membrane associated rhomboid family serine protease
MSRNDYPEPDEDSRRFDWPVPWHAHILPLLMIGAMTAIWVRQFFGDQIGVWGVSAKALAAGQYQNILLHMAAHGPVAHILMNMVALYALGPRLIARLGRPLPAAAAFLLLFVASGLCGAALFLAIHPHGTVPMVGASGALYGLFGTLVRLPADGTDIVPIDRDHGWRLAKDFVRDNGWLFLLFTVPNLLMGREGGVAWEAHLGGFLFGLFAGPAILRRIARETCDVAAAPLADQQSAS